MSGSQVIEIVSLGRVYGGSEVFIDQLVRLLGKRFVFRVVSPTLPPLAEALARQDVPAVWLPARSSLRAHAALAWHWLTSSLSGSRPGLVVMNGRGAAYWAPAYRLVGVPVLVIRHTELRGALEETAYRCCARFAETIVAVSHTVASQHPAALAATTQVIHNWFDGRRATGCTTVLATTPLLLKYVGRLIQAKGLHAVVEALGQLSDVRLDVYGDGPLRPWLEKASRADDRLTLHGFVSNVQDRLAEPGLLICPSFSESFSLVLVEATLSGNLCLASDIPTHREVLPDDYPPELFFEPGNPDALASSIRFAQRLVAVDRSRVQSVWQRTAEHVAALASSGRAADAYTRAFARHVRPIVDDHAAASPGR